MIYDAGRRRLRRVRHVVLHDDREAGLLRLARQGARRQVQGRGRAQGHRGDARRLRRDHRGAAVGAGHGLRENQLSRRPVTASARRRGRWTKVSKLRVRSGHGGGLGEHVRRRAALRRRHRGRDHVGGRQGLRGRGLRRERGGARDRQVQPQGRVHDLLGPPRRVVDRRQQLGRRHDHRRVRARRPFFHRRHRRDASSWARKPPRRHQRETKNARAGGARSPARATTAC